MGGEQQIVNPDDCGVYVLSIIRNFEDDHLHKFRMQDIVNKLNRLGAYDTDLVFIRNHTCTQRAHNHTKSQLHVMADYMYADIRFKVLLSWRTELRDFDSTQAFQCGWSLFEGVIAAFAGTLVYDDPQVVDLILVHFFGAALESKTFTSGSDFDIVSKLFKRLLY